MNLSTTCSLCLFTMMLGSLYVQLSRSWMIHYPGTVNWVGCVSSVILLIFFQYACRTVRIGFRRLYISIYIGKHSGRVIRNTPPDVLHFQSNKIYHLLKHTLKIIKLLFYTKYNYINYVLYLNKRHTDCWKLESLVIIIFPDEHFLCIF